MKPPLAEAHSYEFRFPHLDTVLRLEVQSENVTVYASRDTFSVLRKELFIREVAAEGFIDSYMSGFGNDTAALCSGIHWILDDRPLPICKTSEARAQRFARRTFTSSVLLAAAVFSFVFGGGYYGGSAQSGLNQVGMVHGSPMANR
jgi:hypothetical protein